MLALLYTARKCERYQLHMRAIFRSKYIYEIKKYENLF